MPHGPIPDIVARARTQTTAQMLAQAADRWPDNTALLIDGTRLSNADLLADSRDMARGLAGMGLSPGDTLALLMPNCADFARLFYAAGMLGACTLTLNTRFRGPELAYALGRSGARMLIVGNHALPHVDYRARLIEALPALADWNGHAPLAVPEAPALGNILCLGDAKAAPWPDAGSLAKASTTITLDDIAARAAVCDPAAPALMMFSSGTTARPKACLLSHRALNMTGAALADRFSLAPDDCIYNPMPFFHMSTMLPMAASRASGAAHVCTAHFDPAEALTTMESERATFAYLSFPAIVSGILEQPDFADRDLSAVRLFHAVGPADLMRRYARGFPNATYLNAYGLTEASGVPVWTGPDDTLDQALRDSGTPFAGTDIRAADPDTGAALPPGRKGELQLRGPCLFDGYHDDPDSTAQAMTDDGWLRSGDLGRVDSAGRVTFEGRLKDMLKIGGENVAALEIETLLTAHPAVKMAQVIGVPDTRLGEVPAAFVELAPGEALEPQALIDWCAGRIALFKLPRHIRQVTDWPMSATKVQKFRLPRDFDPDAALTPRKS